MTRTMRLLLVALCLATNAYAASRVGYVQYFDDLDHLLYSPKQVSDVASVRDRGAADTDDGSIYYYVADATDATNTTTIFEPTYGGRWFRSMSGPGTGTITEVIASNTLIVDPVAGDDLTGTRGRLDLPYQTLASAAAALQNGDTIVMRPGTNVVACYTNAYTEPTQYEAPIIISNRSNWSIQASPGAIIQGDDHGTIMLVDACSNWAIDGLTFRGAGTNDVPADAYYAALQLYRTNANFSITRCSFSDIGEHGIATLWGQRHARYFRIANNYGTRIGNPMSILTYDGTFIAVSGRDGIIEGNVGTDILRGIEIEGSVGLGINIIIRDNVLYDVWNIGIMMFGNSTDAETFRRISITGNNIRGVAPTHPWWLYGGFGITWEGNMSGVINGNTISRFALSGINVYGSRFTDIGRLVIDGNNVSNVGDAGIQLIPYPGKTNQVFDCVISDNSIDDTGTEGGIKVGGIGHRIMGNVVTKSQGPGITTYTNGICETRGIVIEGNTVTTNGTYGVTVAQGAVGTVVRGNTYVGNTSGTVLDNGSTTLIERFPTLGTTANPDIDVALADKMDADETTATIDEAARTWDLLQQFYQAHFKAPPTSDQTNYTGTAFSLDCAGPMRAEWEITGDAALALLNVPAEGDSIGKRFQVNMTSSQSTNCILAIDPLVTMGTGRSPGAIKAGEFVTLWLDWNGTNFIGDWRGDQSDPMDTGLGGTGEIYGKARDALDVLGSISWTSTTNAELDLASGTHFRLPNDRDVHFVAPASRMSSTLTNTHIRLFSFEMLHPAADRIISIDTNYWTPIGIDQYNTNPAGGVFVGRGANWGPAANENWMAGNLSTNVVAGGGAEPAVDYTADMVEYWGLQNASGNLTGENGFHLTALGGTYTYQAAGLVETYSITNTGDSSLIATNPSPSLQIEGSDSFSINGWVHLANAATDFRYVLSRYDVTLADRVFALRTSGGYWQFLLGTNAASATTWNTGIAAVTGANFIGIVYDGSVPELKFSLNGSSFATMTLNGSLLNEPVAFALGGSLDNGAAASSRTAGYEQWAIYDVAKPLSHFQGLYNGGAGLARASW